LFEKEEEGWGRVACGKRKGQPQNENYNNLINSPSTRGGTAGSGVYTDLNNKQI